jgi:coenzyme F420 hydrogenase subunit beta
MEPRKEGIPATVQEIVAQGLCVQCGMCAAACPRGAIVMSETPAGLLLASIREERCSRCGACRRLCPGAGLDLQGQAGEDPVHGPLRAAFVAHAADDALRCGGQSGGAVAALLLFLIERGHADAALEVAMPADGTLRPLPLRAQTREEILSAQGSKYCPVAPWALLPAVRDDERLAIVALPCQMHALQLARRRQERLAAGIRFRIGLFCDRTLLYSCIERMIEDAGLARCEVAGLEYRSKSRSGWPGEVCFTTFSGQKRFHPPSLRTAVKEYFTPPRCRTCFDKLNVFSDLSVGDAWGVSDAAAGDSVILVRSETGRWLLNEAVAHGYLRAAAIDARLVFRGQDTDARRANFASFMRAARRMGVPRPEFPGLDGGTAKGGRRRQDAQSARVLRRSIGVAASRTIREALDRVRAWQRADARARMDAAPLAWARRLLRRWAAKAGAGNRGPGIPG